MLIINAKKQKDKNNKDDNDKELNLRFCPEHEVGKKRQQLYIAKCQFYAKINHLKSKG